jgi:hypothetical protein
MNICLLPLLSRRSNCFVSTNVSQFNKRAQKSYNLTTQGKYEDKTKAPLLSDVFQFYQLRLSKIDIFEVLNTAMGFK